MPLDNNRNLKFIKNRSCTNCCFLFVFIFFLIGWGAITFFAFKYGDPERVFLPTDSDGSICGRGSNANKPFLFYFNILKCAKLSSITQGCNTKMVCISQCPNYTISYSKYKDKNKFDQLNEFEKLNVRSHLICIDPISSNDFDNSEIPNLLAMNNCASVYIKSEPRFGRCLPSELKTKRNQLVDDKNDVLMDDNNKPLNPKSFKETSKAFAITFNAKALGELILDDILTAKWFIITGLIFGMIVSLIWILLMQLMSGFMVWTSMIVLIFLSGFFSIFSYKKYKFFKSLNSTEIDMFEDMDLEDTLEFDLFDLIKVQLNSILFDSRVWLASTIISVIIFFLLFVTFIALRQRVRIAISLIKEASKAIMEAKFTLIFPLFPYIFHLLVFVFSVVNALLIVATYKKAYRFESGPSTGQYCDPKENVRMSAKCVKYQLLDDKYVFWVQGYNLFGFLWACFFIHGMCQLIFAGVFSRYYWTPNKKKHLPEFLILNSTYTAFRYHIGSIALGSFFSTTVKILQIILEYIDRKCKQYANNPVAKGIIWCFRCCFWILDNFLRYINTNAYIMIAVYGKGYFESAKDAFNLILNNIIRAIIIDKVADYLLFFGKLSVTGIVGFATYYTIENYQSIPIISGGKDFPILHYAYLPVIIISIGTYLVASTFFSVYEMAVNTIFLCFLKDCQENDGSQDKPYFMSKGLLKILNYQNKLSSESLTETKSEEKETFED